VSVFRFQVSGYYHFPLRPVNRTLKP
jgi:hypothetical protein